MILAFIALTPPHPIGGVATVYEFAGAMAARGHDVRLFHVGGYERLAETIDDISWFSFEEGIAHHFTPGDDADRAAFREADVVFGYSADGSMPEHTGLPAVFVQGYRMLDPRDELATFQAPCPKICVAEWLVDVGLSHGVPAAELVHVQQGMDHARFRITRPIDDRPPQISFCYNPHPQKGASLALAVLGSLKEELPALEAVVFGSLPPGDDFPAWVTYRTDPVPDELPEIYNQTRVFLCPSIVEGFGLTNIEAMACGAALVTTDNGGARDYAIHDRTALVSPVGDVDAMVSNSLALLRDDGRRAALAKGGQELVQRFQWSESGRRLEEFLERYLADPAAYGVPLAVAGARTRRR